MSATPGIAPDRMNAVLEPFVQADDDGNAHSYGVGLGLAVAKGLTEALGGVFTAESGLGKGYIVKPFSLRALRDTIDSTVL